MVITVDQGMCMRCGACVGTCPSNALTLEETAIRVSDECILCLLCTRVCPVGAVDDVEV